MESATKQRTRWSRPKARATWVPHSGIRTQLKQHDCSVVGLLAEIAKDKAVEPALRLRAIERLATLQYLPGIPSQRLEEAAAEQAMEDEDEEDVAEIIAASWKKEPLS